MSWGDAFKNFTTYLTGEALVGTLEKVQDKIDETTKKVIKALTLYVMFVIGVLFLLIGLSNWLDARFLWMDGTGMLAVGAAVILLGFFAKAVR